MKREKFIPAKEFAQEHWPQIFTGAVASAVILLLIHYYRQKNSSDADTEGRLQQLLDEADTDKINETSMLLETGSEAVRLIPDAEELAEELASGLPKGKARTTMITLGRLTRMHKSKK